MTDLPRDIFTEPDFDPDTLANLGPLGPLAGIFESDAGFNAHPVDGGIEEASYIERYELQPIDPQTNGPQLFYGLRYHVHIVQAEGIGTFHDQVGYWLWEPATETVIQTLAIPRAQVALASGHAPADATTFTLSAERGSTSYGICSNPFLEEAFTTLSFTITVTTHPDGTWTYAEDTLLKVLGRDDPVHHTDTNTLRLIAPPTPNPLAAS